MSDFICFLRKSCCGGTRAFKISVFLTTWELKLQLWPAGVF